MRMYRRRPHRTVSLVPGLAGACWAWDGTGEPAHQAGLVILLAVACVAWPLLIASAVFLLPTCAAALVPRLTRAAWRHGRARPPIPRWLRRAVYIADRRRCVFCRSRSALQVDHVLPWSLGGLMSLFNLMTLCGRCNRVKSNFWIARDGTVFYRPFAGADRADLAARILAAERRARLSPVRWVRAAFALVT